jgi:hypothetical protein
MRDTSLSNAPVFFFFLCRVRLQHLVCVGGGEKGVCNNSRDGVVAVEGRS